MTDPRQRYAQARVQARHARLPPRARWRGPAASRDLEHWLEAVRRLPAGADWGEFHAARAPATRELALQRAWVAQCREVGAWQPAAWHAAFAWCEPLPLLPALVRLRADRPLPAALHGEPRLAPLAGLRGGALALALRSGPLAPLDAVDVPGAWLAEFQRRWPSMPRRTRAVLERFVARTQALLAGGLPRESLLESLEGHARRALRSGAGTPVAGFAWLLCVAIDLAELRGGTAARLLGPGDARGDGAAAEIAAPGRGPTAGRGP